MLLNFNMKTTIFPEGENFRWFYVRVLIPSAFPAKSNTKPQALTQTGSARSGRCNVKSEVLDYM